MDDIATRPVPPRRDRARKWSHRLLTLGGLVPLAAFGAVWQGGLRDEFAPRNWGVVEQGLVFRSGQLSAGVCRRTLEENRVMVIVNLGEDKPDKDDQLAEMQATAALGIVRTTLFLKGDGTGPVDSYARAVAEVARGRDTGEPVLVHCSAGTQRTGGVIAAYQLLVRKMAPTDVVAEMRSHGWRPSDNPNLLPYLNANMPAIAAALVERGVISEVPGPVPQLVP